MSDRTVNRSAILLELAVGAMLGCVVGFLDHRLPSDRGFWVTVTMVMLIAVGTGFRAGTTVVWRAAAIVFVAAASSGTVAMWTMVNSAPSEQPAVGPPAPVLALSVIVVALGWALIAAVVSWSVRALAKRA